MTALAALGVGLFALSCLAPSVVRAQSSEDPPVPPPAKKDPAPSPGFDETPAKKTKARKKAKASKTEEEEPLEPVDVPEPGSNDRLIEQIRATRGDITLGELIDEIMSDVTAELTQRPLRKFSPMAIRQISLGANIKPNFARKLRNVIVAHIHRSTKIRMKRCIECETTRTRIENGQWMVTKGLVTSDALKRVGASIGIKTFLDVAFGFDPENGVLEMDFQVIRARDAQVVWAETFRADETTPILLRGSDAPQKRKDRLRDLQMLLEGRPFYGYMAYAGFMLIPYDDPIGGDITGATAGYRIYERFGPDRQVMFGLDLMGFLNTSRLAGAVLSAGSWWVPFRPDLVNPELRLGLKVGALIAGSEGNTAVFQAGAEVLLRYRFGLYAYVTFLTKTQFNNNDLGGVGASAGISFNW